MKPITTPEKLPKFLIVNEYAAKRSHNKFLRNPFKTGELVKVLPFEQQVSSFNGCEPHEFRKRFVQIVRKDSNGNWSLKCDDGWECFNFLTIKNK